MKIDLYLEKLAAKSPAPGGGSAAALAGALGASLLCMTAKYVAVKTEDRRISEIIKSAEKSRRRLRKLMKEDESAYIELSKAIAAKNKNLGAIYKKAAAVPLEACGVIADCLKKCKELYPYCRTSIKSDLKEAAIILEAGFFSAELNVEANLKGIADAEHKRKIKRLLLKQKTLVTRNKKEILDKI